MTCQSTCSQVQIKKWVWGQYIFEPKHHFLPITWDLPSLCLHKRVPGLMWPAGQQVCVELKDINSCHTDETSLSNAYWALSSIPWLPQLHHGEGLSQFSSYPPSLLWSSHPWQCSNQALVTALLTASLYFGSRPICLQSCIAPCICMRKCLGVWDD